VTSLPIIGYNVIMALQWVGIVGRNGSGKSSVCDYLGANGYKVVSLSDIVRQVAAERAIKDDRNSLTQLANDLKKENGLEYFAKMTFSQVKNDQLVVFDSVRHPSEIDFLKQKGVVFIGIDAELKDCYDRIKARGKGTDFVSFDEFKKQDEFEMQGKSHGQSIIDCLNECKYRITNDEGLSDLFDQIDSILDMEFNHLNVK